MADERSQHTEFLSLSTNDTGESVRINLSLYGSERSFSSGIWYNVFMKFTTRSALPSEMGIEKHFVNFTCLFPLKITYNQPLYVSHFLT